MSYSYYPGPPRQMLFDTLNNQSGYQKDNEKRPNVEHQFRRICDPNASWVLVTGFPRPATDRILMTFRSVGGIVSKHWSKEGLHLQFSNPCESARAVELDKLCIAGYPVRIQAIPRLSGETKCCFLRQMGEGSCRNVCRREMEPLNLEFFTNWLNTITRFLRNCLNKFNQFWTLDLDEE